VRAWGRKRREVSHIRSKGRSGEKRKRDFSLREPTHSQERMRKKKSARSVRNDGGVAWAAEEEVGSLFDPVEPFGMYKTQMTVRWWVQRAELGRARDSG
jgi:hypothetical protein